MTDLATFLQVFALVVAAISGMVYYRGMRNEDSGEGCLAIVLLGSAFCLLLWSWML